MNALRSKGLEEPTGQQLPNFLQAFKRKKLGEASMNVGEFEEWCQSHSVPPPITEPNQAFVVSFRTDINKDASSSTLRVFISTPRLLGMAIKNNRLHVDATYKCNFEGLPVMLVGTTDQDRHFHPIGIGVTSGETAEDYAFIFRGIVSGLEIVHGVAYRPEILIADAADAITNGFKDVFGDGLKRVYCWAHVNRAVDKKLLKIKDEETRKRIRDDIYEMQVCESELIFQTIIDLFFAKWAESQREDVAEFMRYFRKEWINSHRSWYEGYAPGVPSTNNALESTNCRIKMDETLRVREPLRRFLVKVQQAILPEWSRQRDPTLASSKVFAQTPSKPLALWTKAFQWKTQEKPVLSLSRGDGSRMYFFPANGTVALTPEMVNQYRSSFRNLDWPSFNEYARKRNQLWVIQMFENEWESATCSCPNFMKEYICKHTIGLAIRKKLCEPPAAAKNVPIGMKRKRGRPQLASQALVRD